PVFFTVARCLRHLAVSPPAQREELLKEPALWVVPAEERIKTEALRRIDEAKTMGISEVQFWKTLGALAVAGEALSEAQLEALGLWQQLATDRILKLTASFFSPGPRLRQPELAYEFDHPGYHGEVMAHLDQHDITRLHHLLAEGCIRCWRDPHNAAHSY